MKKTFLALLLLSLTLTGCIVDGRGYHDGWHGDHEAHEGWHR